MSPFAGGLRIIGWEVEMGNPRTVLVAIVILGWASSVNAQTFERERVELGIGAGGAASWWAPSVAGPEVRVSVPMGDRKSIEAIGGVSAVRVDGDTVGFYGVQIQQRLTREPDSKVQPFISYGLIGVFFNSRSGGQFLSGGSHTQLMPPFIGLIGGGAQRRLTSRLNARLEVQAVMALVVPVAVRVSAGVSMPLGRARQ
jgi:hypothetical protein